MPKLRLPLLLGFTLLGAIACDKKPAPPAPPPQGSVVKGPPPSAGSKPPRPRPKPPQAIRVEGKKHLAFAPGTALADFSILQQGQPINLGGPRQKPMLLHLWASWCGPCVKELPDLLAFGRKGLVEVVAVSVDDHWPLVQKYFRGDIPKEVAWDPKIVLEPGLGVRSIPTTFLVDNRGNLRMRWNGLQDWQSPQMSKSIMHELAKPPVSSK